MTEARKTAAVKDTGMFTRSNMVLPLWATEELDCLRRERDRAVVERDQARRLAVRYLQEWMHATGADQ